MEEKVTLTPEEEAYAANDAKVVEEVANKHSDAVNKLLDRVGKIKKKNKAKNVKEEVPVETNDWYPVEDQEEALEDEDRYALEYLDNVFSYHPPKNGQKESYEDIRDAGKYFAKVILYHAPSSIERDEALNKVREAVMWANAAIACND